MIFPVSLGKEEAFILAKPVPFQSHSRETNWRIATQGDRYSKTASITKRSSYSFRISVDAGAAATFGLKVLGITIGGKAMVELNMSMGHWGSVEERHEKTISYLLKDNDPDTFYTDIYVDEVFGTLLFITDENRSFSSKPHENWTQPLGGPQENQAPEIVSRQPTRDPAIQEGSSVDFSIVADDPDGDTLSQSWWLDGLKVSEGNSYTYSAESGSAGTHTLVARVNDSSLWDECYWTISVVRTNRAPLILTHSPPALNVQVREGESARFLLSAIDPDGDTMSYSWLLDGSLVSTGQSYDLATNYDSQGLCRVIGKVSDSQQEAQIEWTVTIENVNRCPKITAFTPKSRNLTVEAGDEVKFTANVMDEDEDPYDYEWKLDDNLVGNEPTYTFWTSEDLAGDHIVSLVVTDGIDSDALLWTVSVEESLGLHVAVFITLIVFSRSARSSISAPRQVCY